jgi:hypothetical protein
MTIKAFFDGEELFMLSLKIVAKDPDHKTSEEQILSISLSQSSVTRIHK